MRVTERKFEAAIEAWLLDLGGYSKGDPRAFDRALGLDTGEVLAFVRATHRQGWAGKSVDHREDRARLDEGPAPVETPAGCSRSFIPTGRSA